MSFWHRLLQPLVLISAGYDALLGTRFLQKGKKYAVISTLVGASLEADMGNVLIEYSDRIATRFAPPGTSGVAIQFARRGIFIY